MKEHTRNPKNPYLAHKIESPIGKRFSKYFVKTGQETPFLPFWNRSVVYNGLGIFAKNRSLRFLPLNQNKNQNKEENPKTCLEQL